MTAQPHSAPVPGSRVTRSLKAFLRNAKNDRFLLVLISPVVVYFIVFYYFPMYGLVIAFKDFSGMKGILGSPWAGLKWFIDFFDSYYFFRLLKNTLLISIYSILWSFPIPILFALLINEVRDGPFKRFVQSVSYLPHFISTVVIVGMVLSFLSNDGGIVNTAIKALGGKPIAFMTEPRWFRTVYIGSGIWQQFGWESIIYLAAISAVNPQLYEAATIDGASRLQQAIHITIPSILPTIVILLILSMGDIMNVGFEKIILMYSPVTYDVADVISTYIFRRGIKQAEYSLGTAVGLFNSVINFIILIGINKFSKKVSNIGLW